MNFYVLILGLFIFCMQVSVVCAKSASDKDVPNWENELINALNIEPVRASGALPYPLKTGESDSAMSLNGIWKFNFVPTPSQRPKDFYKKDYHVDSWSTIKVPSSWQIEGFGTVLYSSSVYPFRVKIPYVTLEPPKHFTAYKERNGVGSYRREFALPRKWDKGPIFLRFDGAGAAFYVWLNGDFVGYAEDSFSAHEFRVDSFLSEGTNTLAVEVYQHADGSYLEDQDFFRYAGIFRDVTLYTEPQVTIRDFFLRNGLENQYSTGVADVDVTLHNYNLTDVENLEVTFKISKDGKLIFTET